VIDLVQGVRAIMASGPRPLMVTYGELSSYDPKTHAGKFLLPLHRDQTTDEPIETGYAPIGTLFTGVGIGMQFPPVFGAQAILLFVDGDMHLPIAAVLLSNSVEYPPFVDGKSRGWKDAKASAIKTTDDGPTPGDGVGGARVVGAGYASVVAPIVELSAEGLDANLDRVVTMRDLNALITTFNAHVHSGVQTGAGNTGAPTSTQSATGSAFVRAKH
jgi:type VI secretion system (T6SS) baseplate-like injector VgrG/GpV-like protein with Apex motif